MTKIKDAVTIPTTLSIRHDNKLFNKLCNDLDVKFDMTDILGNTIETVKFDTEILINSPEGIEVPWHDPDTFAATHGKGKSLKFIHENSEITTERMEFLYKGAIAELISKYRDSLPMVYDIIITQCLVKAGIRFMISGKLLIGDVTKSKFITLDSLCEWIDIQLESHGSSNEELGSSDGIRAQFQKWFDSADNDGINNCMIFYITYENSNKTLNMSIQKTWFNNNKKAA